MGANFYSYVVCGFPLAIERINKEIKKFDEYDGKPYMTEEFDYYQYSVGDYKFSREDSEEIDDECDVDGLTITTSTDRAEMFIGSEVARTGDIAYGDTKCIELNTKVPDAVSKFAGMIGVEPKLYLVQYCSY